jgi:flagellar basal-body rod modification protein FlgD
MDISSITNAAITGGSSATGSQTPPTTTSSGVDGLANEQTFLKLFVAQLKNQDPLNPQDGTQFVAQLAQFSQLEQSLQMRQDLDVVRQVMEAIQNSAGATGGGLGTRASQ